MDRLNSVQSAGVIRTCTVSELPLPSVPLPNVIAHLVSASVPFAEEKLPFTLSVRAT